MAFYGISIKPLIMHLDYLKTSVFQVWLADDATGAGSLHHLKVWWDIVSNEGRKYGYIVSKPSKSWLILKDESQVKEAEELFAESPLQITTSGKRHLGAAIGTEQFKTEYLHDKVVEWCKRLKVLTKMAH